MSNLFRIRDRKEIEYGTAEGRHDMSKRQEKARILIEGPTVKGTFFIRDSENRIWDGKEWRGFGAAAEFYEFKDALKDWRKAQRRVRCVKVGTQ